MAWFLVLICEWAVGEEASRPCKTPSENEIGEAIPGSVSCFFLYGFHFNGYFFPSKLMWNECCWNGLMHTVSPPSLHLGIILICRKKNMSSSNKMWHFADLMVNTLYRVSLNGRTFKVSCCHMVPLEKQRQISHLVQPTATRSISYVIERCQAGFYLCHVLHYLCSLFVEHYACLTEKDGQNSISDLTHARASSNPPLTNSSSDLISSSKRQKNLYLNLVHFNSTPKVPWEKTELNWDKLIQHPEKWI